MANPFEADRQKNREQKESPDSGLNARDILRDKDNSDKDVKKVKLPPAASRAGEKPIGTAVMQSDESIVLNITGKTGSTIGEAEIEYRRGDKQYDDVLKHIGGIKKGETKVVLPWLEIEDDGKPNKGPKRATVDGGIDPGKTEDPEKEISKDPSKDVPKDTTQDVPKDPAKDATAGTDKSGAGPADVIVPPSPAFLTEVTTTYNKMSLETRDVIEKEGTVIAPVRRLTDALPELKGQKPRGWPPGLTWDAVDGAYSPSRNMVVVAEETQKADSTWVKSTRGEDITRHEVGHALDYGMGKLSNSKDFTTAYEEDIKNMPVAIHGSLEYFRQSGDGGKEEACAEGVASREGGSTSGSTFDTGFPKTIKAIDDALLDRRSKMTIQPGATTSPIVQPIIEQKDLPKLPDPAISPRPPLTPRHK